MFPTFSTRYGISHLDKVSRGHDGRYSRLAVVGRGFLRVWCCCSSRGEGNRTINYGRTNPLPPVIRCINRPHALDPFQSTNLHTTRYCRDRLGVMMPECPKTLSTLLSNSEFFHNIFTMSGFLDVDTRGPMICCLFSPQTPAVV